MVWASAHCWELFLIIWELRWTGLGVLPSFPSHLRSNIVWAELKALCHLRDKVIINATAQRVQNVLSTLQRCRASQASVLQSWYVSVNCRDRKQICQSSLSLLDLFPELCWLSGFLVNQKTLPAPIAWADKHFPQHLSLETLAQMQFCKRNGD